MARHRRVVRRRPRVKKAYSEKRGRGSSFNFEKRPRAGRHLRNKDDIRNQAAVDLMAWHSDRGSEIDYRDVMDTVRENEEYQRNKRIRRRGVDY